jgi:hypothetical protein
VAVTDSPGPGRVLVAESAGPLVAEPTWTRYDTLADCRCYGFDSFAGRQSELDTTDTGFAAAYFHDRTSVLDDDDLVGCQIMLQLYDPVAAVWHPRWRGHIDDIDHDIVDVPGASLANVAFRCVGIFDYLGSVKMLPGVFGNVAPAGMNGIVFYEDGRVDDRIFALLGDAQIAAAMRVVFTGNIDVNETLYDPDDVILQGLRDAADAEFPGVANVYEDRFGRTVFHGRFARFDPEGTESGGANWDFVRWDAATREDVTAGVAQIREFAYNRPRARIVNAYVAWPRADENGVEFDREQIASLVRTDATSISEHGYRAPIDAPDLIIKENFNNGNTGAEECGLFGDFYMANYADVRKAIQRVVFKSHRPGDARAAATWDLMCRADISDAIQLTVDEAGLADEAFFIDGIAIECRPLNPEFDLVTMTPNLTPASYYETDVFNA